MINSQTNILYIKGNSNYSKIKTSTKTKLRVKDDILILKQIISIIKRLKKQEMRIYVKYLQRNFKVFQKIFPFDRFVLWTGTQNYCKYKTGFQQVNWASKKGKTIMMVRFFISRDKKKIFLFFLHEKIFINFLLNNFFSMYLMFPGK